VSETFFSNGVANNPPPRSK